MTGQVGGVSFHKRPLQTLKPDYVLKPLHTDHRGIRKMAFYEAIRVASCNQMSHSYSIFLVDKVPTKSYFQRCGEIVDTLALSLIHI